MANILLKITNQGELIINFINNTHKTGKANQTKGFIQGRIKLLESYWIKYQDLHEKLIENQKSQGNISKQYFEEETYFEIEKVYCESIGELNDLLDNFDDAIPHSTPIREVNNMPQPHGKNEVRLPPIVIPTFSGDYNNWTSFHDLFESLIHNNRSLSNVHKLHHLKSYLSGDAEHLLRQFSVQDDNYEPAWELLKKRFSNKRILLNTQFERLLGQSKQYHSNADGLRRIMNTSSECIASVTNLLQPDQMYDSLVLYIITQKLDGKTLEAWERSIQGKDELPKLETLITFLEDTCRTIELINSTKKSYDLKPVPKFEKANDNKYIKSIHHANSTNPSDLCAFCSKQHQTQACFKFRKQKVQDRIRFIKSKSLCEICFVSNHKSNSCPSKVNCAKCSKPHHTLLHSLESSIATTREATSNNSLISDPIPFNENELSTIHSHLSTNHNKRTLLATALISVKNALGQTCTLRALLDQGSEASIILASTAKFLNLKLIKSTISIKGIGNSVAGKCNSFTSLTFGSIHDSHSTFNIKALVMNRLTNLIPSSSICITNWSHLRNLQLADPEYYNSGRIDLILGADIYGELLSPDVGVIKGPKGSPTAQLTALGWILSGQINSNNYQSKYVSESSNQLTNAIQVLSYHSQISVCEQLRKFWEIEEVTTIRNPTVEEQACEDHYRNTHVRLSDGRYEVHLPFKTQSHPPTFGSSKPQSIMRFKQLQTRFQKNISLKDQYVAFMNEYITLGHMIPHTPSSPTIDNSYYLPHHCVIKSSSTTTKLRVVFDASAKTTDGFSLNDKLHVGPTLQQDLLHILLRWRKYKYVLLADIEKMYRQIRVTEDHQRFQRIIWVDSDNRLLDYDLTTVTYGTACAPFLAIRTLQQLAHDEKNNFPIASRHTLIDMYVDDFISGGDTIEDTIKLKDEMFHMFRSGGFNLRKWSTNSQEILVHIPEHLREITSLIEMCRDNTIKTLGVHWNPSKDQFEIKISLPPLPKISTKRTLLSDVARLFDPLGWLAPVVISAKIVFQQLWLKGLEWDEPLPNDVLSEWISLRSQLPLLASITIPRWIGTSNNSNIQYHGFCDASMKAYAAVIYIRTSYNGIINTQLLTSKTRVAPIKTISLPHLELCGATLLAKLMSQVITSMMIPDTLIFAWTDSTIVLNWLQNRTHKQVFVANRVSTILSHLKPTTWKHVRSQDNPADIASRGICPSTLKDHTLWWKGPAWLQLSTEAWPGRGRADSDDSKPSPKIQVANVVVGDECTQYIKSFSCYYRMIRVTAFCFRFIQNARIKDPSMRRLHHLNVAEHRNALHQIIKATQKDHYATEIRQLKLQQDVKNTKIASLEPFMCNNNFLRVGGRLRYSNLQYDQKFPILIPHESHLAKLIIKNIHECTLHGGIKLTLTTLRLRYWIPNARSAIRKVIHKCTICHRQSAQTKQQIMSSLPVARVTPSKPFSHSGVDFAGPFDIRLSKHRGRGTFKGYICVFVCFATKAIHLELVGDLTSKSFLAAFRRFVSRRGSCTNLYSDNGTNFVGANKELQLMLSKSIKGISSELADALCIVGTEWHFIPPNTPNFGGLWEAAVKSMKYHLKRIIGPTILTFEEIYTLLTQIEAVLNSRPLCQLNADIEDLKALTPGHFLVGEPLVSVPEPSLLNTHGNLLHRWQLVQKIHQDFWNSWSKEYLTELQQRPKKWSKKVPNLKVGDIVLVKDERIPPANWLIAKVLETHPGQDGIVRVVTIKHKSGIMKRPASKLSILPINDDIP